MPAFEAWSHGKADRVTICDLSELAQYARARRDEGFRLVLTGGCFDVLHVGHVTYLQQACLLGDVLMVGVNSDESVQRLTGPGRPLNPAADRVIVLSALSCVDYVTVFDGTTPNELIAAVRPDVYVKGGDYAAEDLPERELVESLGGEVRTLAYIDGHSTSALLHRARGS
jgi:D-beta-D-heptose 7-phosphate kinase/D-beta-D-heptose 1-phosphate adenosyltransferase